MASQRRLSNPHCRIAALLLALGLALPAGARAEPAPGQARLELRPWVDYPLTVLAGALVVPIELGVAAGLPPQPSGPPQNPPGGFDGLAPLRLDPSIARVSDVVLYGTLAAGLASAVGFGIDRDQLWPLVFIYAEVLLVDGLLTESFKRVVGRPRPYTYDSGIGKADDLYSFFSGHAALTSGAAFATARLLDLVVPMGSVTRLLLYSGAATLTVLVSVLRVAAGEHFPSDVLVGALVGTSLGLALPTLHQRQSAVVVGTPLPTGGYLAGFAFRF